MAEDSPPDHKSEMLPEVEPLAQDPASTQKKTKNGSFRVRNPNWKAIALTSVILGAATIQGFHSRKDIGAYAARLYRGMASAASSAKGSLDSLASNARRIIYGDHGLKHGGLIDEIWKHPDLTPLGPTEFFYNGK